MGDQNQTGVPDKGLAFIAYIIFFIPLLVSKRSDFATYHTNQGTILFIFAAAGNIVLSVVPIIGWMFMPFFALFVFILWIIGIMNVARSLKKPLPLIGGWTIIK